MSEINKTDNEKRDFTRMNLNSDVEILYAGEKFQGRCTNLSGAGVSIETDQHFDTGAKLKLTISQENNKLQAFSAEATVLRVQPKADGKMLIGLSLNEIFD
jgi:hypothetical protein